MDKFSKVHSRKIKGFLDVTLSLMLLITKELLGKICLMEADNSIGQME